MSTKYPSQSAVSSRVQELPTITATELKNSTANVLEDLANRQAVAITRHNKPRAVLLSIQHYEALLGRGAGWLEDLKLDYLGMLNRMQAPEQKEAAIRAFNATPEELGKAALAAAKRKKIGVFRDSTNP